MSRLERLYSPPEIGAPGKRAARGTRRDLMLAGLFVLAMGAVALGAMALVIPGLFGGVKRLEVYFAGADGLDAGVQVIQEGYVIGMVESVGPVFPLHDPDAAHCPAPSPGGLPRSPRLPCFRATLRILNDWPVPAGSYAQLGSAGLLQGEVIRIHPGASEQLLANGARMDTRPPEESLTGQLSELTDSIQSLVDKTIGPALASIQQQIETIEELLGTGGDNTGNRERLAGVFQNLEALTARVEQAVDAEQIKTIVASVAEASVSLKETSKGLEGKTEAIERAAREYGALAVDMRRLLRQNGPSLERSLDDTQYLLQELAAALTPILTNVEDATRNLSVLSQDLRNNPAVIIKGRKVEADAPWFE